MPEQTSREERFAAVSTELQNALTTVMKMKGIYPSERDFDLSGSKRENMNSARVWAARGLVSEMPRLQAFVTGSADKPEVDGYPNLELKVKVRGYNSHLASMKVNCGKDQEDRVDFTPNYVLTKIEDGINELLEGKFNPVGVE